MTSDKDIYWEREHSFLKHRFLQEYLKNLAVKVLYGHNRTLKYIDAFAGPWSSRDNVSYSDTSFAKAIETLEGVRQYLKTEHNLQNQKFDIFCAKGAYLLTKNWRSMPVRI